MSLARTLYTPAPVDTPGLARWFIADPRSGWLWLAVRLYVGWEWFTAGRHKIWPATGDSWLDNGNALKGFWQKVTVVPEKGTPPIVFGWYRQFLTYMLDHEWYTWFSKLVAIGELTIGLCLIVGAFVGIAAFFGTLMNFNFMLAGSASTNPVLFGIAVFLFLAWRTAGIIGVDRWLLPALHTPWDWTAARVNRRRGGGGRTPHEPAIAGGGG